MYSPEGRGAQELRRLAAPLLRAGWSPVEYETWVDDDLEDEGRRPQVVFTVEVERSGFHLRVTWDADGSTMRLEDPTDEWEWSEALPPLCPLDGDVAVDLTGHVSQVARAEAARRMFAAKGLLDATTIRLSEKGLELRHHLTMLFLGEHVYDVVERHRGMPGMGEMVAALGDEFSWQISAGIRAYPLIVPAPVPGAVARGIAEWCWRRESVVEDWHHKIGDLTMARANIAATHVHLEGVDWPAVRVSLTHPDRRLADGRHLGGLFGEGWPPILESIKRQVDLWQRVDDEIGPHAVLSLLSAHGSRTESVGDWWGSGWFETLTRRAVDSASVRGAIPPEVSGRFPEVEAFADMAAHAPDLLDDDALRWLLRAIFDEQSAIRFGDRPEPAMTLPEWVVDQLAEIFADDDTGST